MNLHEWWQTLHFLRPHWLWLTLAVPVFYLSLVIRDNARARWRRYIEPELLDHLIVSRRRRWRFRPIHLLSLLIILGSIAIAGPTWQREQPPFTEDKATLVIALDLSETMNAIDLSPTRLERVKLKLHDLLKNRNGGRTALFVYAGSTHMVLPFTTDASLLDLYLDSLFTNLMPREGKDTAKALHDIEKFLKTESVPGTILFVTDGIESAAIPALEQFTAQEDQANDILVLGVGTSAGGPVQTSPNRFLEDHTGRRVFAKLNVKALRALSKYDIDATTLTLNDDDIQWIQRHVQHHLQAVQQKDAKTRWIDQGYWLTVPVAAFLVFWFRKGWTIRWTSAALAVVFVLPPSPCVPVVAVGVPSGFSASLANYSWLDLWMTQDQQGRYYFEKGDYKKAAEKFEDPLWRGVASARAGDYNAALNAFVLSDTAEAWYNQGDALAHLGKYPEAVAAFQQALVLRPHWKEAEDNLTLVQSLIPKPKADKKDKEQEAEAPDIPPDQTKFDEKGEKGKQAKVNVKPATMADIWMRNIQTTPADFLRRRFAIQAAKEGR
jgi:Ca-activated chloride channel homolog